MNRMMRILCWTMVVVFPVSLLAGDAAPAMLTSRGIVRVNGSLVPGSYTVYGGEQIATEANASVHLLARGASITLPAGSSILYGGKQLEVRSGRVLVSTTASSGVQARIGNLTVVPAGRNARFQMANSGEKLVLAALNGALRVSDGVHSIVLPSGKMMTSAASQTAGGGPGTGTGTGTGTAASSGGIPGWVIGVLVIGVAGGVIGGLAAVGEFGSASPSIP